MPKRDVAPGAISPWRGDCAKSNAPLRPLGVLRKVERALGAIGGMPNREVLPGAFLPLRGVLCEVGRAL